MSLVIPFLIAAVILIPLAILLWWGARERRQVSSVEDPDFGPMKIYKTYWETVATKPFLQRPVSVSGVGSTSGASPEQKSTLDFVDRNSAELFGLAVVAAREAITAAAPEAQTEDLEVSGIFLDEERNCFELWLSSKSCSTIIPDGVAVSFSGNQVQGTELVH